MALIKDYELPGTGLNVPSAYHVISHIDLRKRTQDVPNPVDHQDDLRNDDNRLYWAAGYVATVRIDVYANSEARTSGKNIIGSIGDQYEYTFLYDPTSNYGIIEQGYNYLKTTEEYSSAVAG